LSGPIQSEISFSAEEGGTTHFVLFLFLYPQQETPESKIYLEEVATADSRIGCLFESTSTNSVIVDKINGQI